MRVAIIGNGGREIALGLHFAEHVKVEKVYFLGDAQFCHFYKKFEFADISPLSEEALKFFKEIAPDYIIIGPERYLEAGIVDFYKKAGLAVIGPDADNTKLESSKIFSKTLMRELGIQTPDFHVFDDLKSAHSFLRSASFVGGWVLKADGLASGKGVFILNNSDDIVQAVKVIESSSIRQQRFLVEEKVTGKEFSAFFYIDENQSTYLGSAADYKRLNDGDLGPNTGGMGALSPVPWFKDEHLKEIKETIIIPICSELKNYSGFLFVGGILTERGIEVLEFNTRMGDPETQTLVPLWQDHLIDIFQGKKDMKLKPLRSIHLVLTSQGYPSFSAEDLDDAQIFSQIEIEDYDLITLQGIIKVGEEYQTRGGRILGLTTVGDSLEDIRSRCYKNVAKLIFKGAHFRGDIGEGRD